jgi:hypothetical protein
MTMTHQRSPCSAPLLSSLPHTSASPSLYQSKRAESPVRPSRQPHPTLRSASPSVATRRRASASPLPRTSLISPRLKPLGEGMSSGKAGLQGAAPTRAPAAPGGINPRNGAGLALHSGPQTHGGEPKSARENLPPRENAMDLVAQVLRVILSELCVL